MDDNLKEKIGIYWRRLQNSGMEDVLQRAMEALKEVNEARQKPNVYSVVRATMSVARAFHMNDLYMHDILDKTKWKKPQTKMSKKQKKKKQLVE